MRMKLVVLICLLLPFSAWSQMEKIDTKKGNNEYRSGRYDVAIKDYTKALENDPEYMEAIFNTGNALQQMARRLQEQAQNAGSEEEKKELITGAKTASEKAASQFASVAKMAKTNEEINKAQYNLGNSRLMSGELDAGIEAYKEALRKVPNDDDARYNLAYAQHLKKQQEQQQQQQDQKQDEQQDQEKKEQEQNQDQQNQEQQNQEQQEPQQLSKEEAEQLLQALMKQEKDLQEELKKKKNRKAQRIKIEKDW
jgi:tetratricopeptide (TPR) repeat protein